MSCYEWEHGEIKLSCSEYRRIKKEMIGAVKEYWENYYANALKLYDKMLEVTKGKRGIEWDNIHHECRFVKTVHYSAWGKDYNEIDLDPDCKVFNSYHMGNKRPSKPKKKDFTPKIDRKNFHLSFEDADISFNDKMHTVTWNVSENNHAREHSRDHYYAKKLFKLLDSVKWTRGTGGTIVGNDEYNRDNTYEGGGSNYVTGRYGPKCVA